MAEAHDQPQGTAVVTIASTDKGFTSKRCGEWTATSGGANTGAQTTTTTTGGANAGAQTTTTTATGGGGTATSLSQCGPGLSASQGISCELAQNLFYEYHRNGKDTTTLSVWSPPVKRYYTAICSKGAGVITCYISGTTVPNAQVQITQAALDGYTPSQASQYARTHDLGPRG